MRTFCTEGPIDPEKNYYVPRKELVKEGLKKVDEWRYFTIFAPRQSGKTTYFQLLIKRIKATREDFLPVWISFENYSDVSKKTFLDFFQDDLNKKTNLSIKKEEEVQRIYYFLQNIIKKTGKDLVLIIDEVEGLETQEIVNKFMHMLRKIYHEKESFGLRSVILTGVSNITGIIQENASPFNIADQINVPYFKKEQIYDLLSQHEKETGQRFDEEVKSGIYENTQGQPGLVGALARDLVEKKCPVGERVTEKKLYKTLDDFTRIYIDKNISNIVSKAKQYPQLMKEILFGEEVPFSNFDDKQKYLSVNGVIDNCDGYCCIVVPLYKKALYATFKPTVNGEKKHFTGPFQRIETFQDEYGKLKMQDIIQNYALYLKKRGKIIFNNPNEGEYQYNFDAYLHSICGFLGARVYPEIIEGGGRVDLVVLKNDWKWIVEIKVYRNISYYENAKKQLLEYLKNSMEKEGWLVFFSEYHEESDYHKEKENGRTSHIWILPVKAKNPSEA